MSEKYDKLLSTILIGNNIVNIAAVFHRHHPVYPDAGAGSGGATVSTMVLTIVVLIFGEVTPKSLAKEMPETIATASVPGAQPADAPLFTPLTGCLPSGKSCWTSSSTAVRKDTITEGELMTMVSEAENDGELTDRESQLIRSAIEFDDVEVEEILTPRVDVRGRGRTTPRWTSWHRDALRRAGYSLPAGLPRYDRQHHRRGTWRIEATTPKLNKRSRKNFITRRRTNEISEIQLLVARLPLAAIPIPVTMGITTDAARRTRPRSEFGQHTAFWTWQAVEHATYMLIRSMGGIKDDVQNFRPLPAESGTDMMPPRAPPHRSTPHPMQPRSR